MHKLRQKRITSQEQDGIMEPEENAAHKSESCFVLEGQEVRARPIAAGLHVVATPIGNLGDITIRALRTLAAADTILCEDSRVTRKLTAHFGISTPLKAYHDHNAARVRPAIMAALGDGAAIALVSDAGTPLVSDPGFKLVEAALAQDIMVTSVPGASAVLAALGVAGLPTDRFFFAGFLPVKSAARVEVLQQLRTVPATQIFYESPKRLGPSLAAMEQVLGDRSACVARELTKLHEEVRRGTLSELSAFYGSQPAPRGEVVVVVAPPEPAEPASDEHVDGLLASALETMSVKAAAATLVAETGRSRRDLYARAVAMRERSRQDQ